MELCIKVINFSFFNSWGVAEIPQIITNFCTKSSHGVSLLFLLTWIAGRIPACTFQKQKQAKYVCRQGTNAKNLNTR